MPTMGQAAPLAPANVTVQDLAPSIAASKKTIRQNGHYPNTLSTLFNGMSGLASSKVP